jgi:hypothetical protein
VLSGGQRKRVNIALELVTDPALMFLDEPTSGLAADDTVALIDLLSNLAKRYGKTIIVTIHQPAKEEFEKFNLAFIMGFGGEPVYFGPSGKDSYDFFGAYRGAPSTSRQAERHRQPARHVRHARPASGPSTTRQARADPNAQRNPRERPPPAMAASCSAGKARPSRWCLGALQELEGGPSAATGGRSRCARTACRPRQHGRDLLPGRRRVWFGTSNAAREIVSRASHLHARAHGEPLALQLRASRSTCCSRSSASSSARCCSRIVFFALGFHGGPDAFAPSSARSSSTSLNSAVALGLLLSTLVTSSPRPPWRSRPSRCVVPEVVLDEALDEVVAVVVAVAHAQ